jgi:predicted secreted protein
MRPLTAAVFILLIPPACQSASTTPASGTQAEQSSQPSELDPERITRLEFYGGRCAGEPSKNGIDGVTGVDLPIGRVFVAELEFTAGTGYAWKATGYDESMVTMVEQRTRPIRGSTEAGSLQLHTMNFRADKAGRTRITFELRSESDPSAAPAEIRRTTIYAH